MKLTSFLKSPNTSLRGSPLWGTFELDAFDDESPIPILRFELVAAAGLGSMSSVVRNDSEASSVRVDVIVKRASRREFCSALGVPLRSRIYLGRILY